MGLGGDERAAAGQDQQTDGDVNEEHPPPVEQIRENPAEDEADDDPDPGHRAVERQCGVAQLPAIERRRDQGQGVRRCQCRADPLNRAGDDEHLDVRPEASEQRGGDEDRDPDLQGALLMCPMCAHECEADAAVEDDADQEQVVQDAVGNELADGDTVTVVKGLKVKGGGGGTVKVGTKVKGIRLLADGADGHDIDAAVPGFGRMQLKSSVVKKVG